VAEINPLGLMEDGRLVALDCHLEIDDDTLFRHADIAALEKNTNRIEGERRMSDIMNVVSNTRVDLVARGIVKGIFESGKNPAQTVAVFRVPGAWEEEGFKILSRYGIPRQGRTVSIDEAVKIAAQNAN
jgi:succinyl-CoA synthetase beta subunit